MPRPRLHDEALRGRLLDEAARLLSTEGPAALSLRKLAALVGTSTTAVYSLFGGKSALVRELFLDAFDRFGRRLAAVELTGDPISDLIRLGVAYRDSALAEPHLYMVMFGQPMPEFEPDDDAMTHAVASMGPLLATVRAGIDAGLLVDTSPEVVAMALWAHVHGLVSLELNRCVPRGFDVAEGYEESMRATLRGWLR